MNLFPRTAAFVLSLAALIPFDPAFSQTPAQRPWPPPRRNTTRQILASKDSIIVAAGLTPLTTTLLPAGDQEIRIWIGGGIAAVEDFYRIIRRDDQVSGERFMTWNLGDRGGAEPGEPDFNAVLLYSMAGQCGHVGRAGYAHACRVRFITDPDWKAILERMERAQLWTLPDESELPETNRMVMDGWGLLVEVRNGATYRAYHHGNPDAYEHPVSRRAVEIADALDPLGALMAPPENRKRYRGLLTLGPQLSEFTPCGEDRAWNAQGGMSYHEELQKSGIDSLAHPVIQRYVEVRGLREYPGLTRFHTPEYDDGIHIDMLYLNRPWNPKECEALPSGRE